MTDWWVDRPWRMIQTNLREIDMIDMDAERYVAELQAFKATAVLFNTAGIIASYPTKLPYHYQSPFLQGDSLGDVIEECHRAGIRLLARTDFSKVRRPIYEMHPEWAYVSPEGQIVDYNGDIHVCINGDYQQHYALEIVRELITEYDVDGIFFNMGGYQVRDYSGNYYGICHCPQCQARFADMFGLALPQAEDMDDPVYHKYVQFKRRTLREHHERVYTFIHDLRPDLCIANHTEFRRGVVRQESNTAIDRPLPHWQYSASDNTKWVTSSYPSMVASNTTVDFIDFPYRHVAVSPHQQKLRLAQALANGGALDYYLIGRLDNHEDRSGYAGIREMFHYHAAHGEDYVGLTSQANVALLNGPEANQAEFRGWFRVLTEGHFLFDTLMVDTALELPWTKYRAIILPDYQPVSDALAQALDSYCAQGGTVIAVSRAAMRDEDYQPRSAPALECLGIERVQAVRSDMRATYLKLDDKTGLRRFAETDLVFVDGNYVYAHYAASAEGRLKLVPPHPFGPPERCYYTTVVDRPGLVVNRYGEGRAIHVPWEPGALFYRQGYTNTLDFCLDLLEGVAGIEPVGGNLSPMVEVTLFQRRDGAHQLLHMVNGSGHFGVSFYPPAVMSDLTVVVPCAAAPHSVSSLVTGAACETDYADGRLTVRVPRLELFEAIKIVP